MLKCFSRLYNSLVHLGKIRSNGHVIYRSLNGLCSKPDHRLHVASIMTLTTNNTQQSNKNIWSRFIQGLSMYAWQENVKNFNLFIDKLSNFTSVHQISLKWSTYLFNEPFRLNKKYSHCNNKSNQLWISINYRFFISIHWVLAKMTYIFWITLAENTFKEPSNIFLFT